MTRDDELGEAAVMAVMAVKSNDMAKLRVLFDKWHVGDYRILPKQPILPFQPPLDVGWEPGNTVIAKELLEKGMRDQSK
ncbi:hypothetical protein SCAR479_00149 [Seiridium cardinale]|uniref:Uncharacterized protein n=1 Tax=Seiridium cardinale TaxID=138064 RepID=A0ABR2Y9H4_9PEZI